MRRCTSHVYEYGVKQEAGGYGNAAVQLYSFFEKKFTKLSVNKVFARTPRDSLMAAETVSEKRCPGCHDVMRPAGWTLTEPEAGRAPIAVLRCPVCGLVTTPWLFAGQEEVASLYTQYSYCSETAWDIPAATLHSLRRWVRQMEPFRRLNRWLDVGCAAGALLRAAVEHGWHAEATELSTVAAERLRSEGFVVHVGFLTNLGLPIESFDVVTMIELIEHLADPMEDLRSIYSLLRPGGALFLTTPNARSLRCRLFGFRETLGPPGHLWGFTPKALRKLLRRVGLRPVRIWTDGLNPYLLLRRIRSASGAGAPNVWAQTQRLREHTITNPLVRALKFSVNVGMRLTRWGDTLKAVAVKPEP